MAIIDYGAIAFKNGKLISTKMFTPMHQTCGFTDDGHALPGADSSFDGNCFVVIGNQQFLVGFYKESIIWWYDHGEAWEEDRYEYGVEMLAWSEYHGWSRWNKSFSTINFIRDITVKPRNGYYVANIRLGADRYKVHFGYGVDFGFYKKTGRVNYYRSPEHYARLFYYIAKHRIKRIAGYIIQWNND